MERNSLSYGFTSIRRDFWGVVQVTLNTQSYSNIPADTILVWDNALNAYKVATSNTNPLVLDPAIRHVRLLKSLDNLQPNTNIQVLAASLFINFPNELMFYNTTTNRFENGVIIDRPAGGYTINS